jgi:hypothetical protein
MSKYDDLRVHFSKSPDERMELLDREIRAPLAATAELAANLRTVDPRAGAGLFGGRFGELLEILEISSRKLADVANEIGPIRARGQGGGGLKDDDLHIFRHDLLTPIGTVRGVAGMLAKADAGQAPDLPADFHAKAEALTATLNEIKDVLDALTDARGRAS